jgi:hypothetical protein
MLFLPQSIASADEGHGPSGKGEVLGFEGEHDPIWHLKAKRPFLIGGYGDNFNYDGSRVTPMLGKAKVVLDTVRDAGTMVVKVTGTINPEEGKTYTGKIKIYYTITKGGPPFREGGVADFIYLHGDSKQGPPVMPKVRSYLAAWGTADVYVNGELVYEGLDGHMMYTERSRDTETRAIYNKDRTGFYSPKDPSNSSIANPRGSEIHFVAHSMEKDRGNFPPHSVWIHLNFEKVIEAGKGHRGFRRGGRCGAGCGCGCNEGGSCAAATAGKCGAGCGCGCNQGGGCAAAMTGKFGAGSGCGVAGCGAGMHKGGRGCSMGMMGVGPCGPGCGCGCLAGGPCSCGAASVGGAERGKATAAPCGPGCGCGCQAGAPCTCGR